jgi:DNA-binding protein H-NS
LPIRIVNFSDKSEKAAHDRIVSLVEQMLELHKQLATARTPQEKTALERQINATDSQIDRLVYDLYGLTEEDIKIVEGKTEPGPKPKGKEKTSALYAQKLPRGKSTAESEAAAAHFGVINEKADED